MARGDQIGRQWGIIQTLISSRIGKTAAELAEELGCNPRTVYRDLEALQVAGFPIYTQDEPKSLDRSTLIIRVSPSTVISIFFIK